MHCKGGKPWGKFHVNDGFLFRANKLCILASSVRLLLLQEAHGGGLMGHFGVYKTQEILAPDAPQRGTLCCTLHHEPES
jgi:hypothetical protein